MTDLLSEFLAHPIVGSVAASIAIAAIALWLAAAWWAYADASRRTDSSLAAFLAPGWILLSTPLLIPFSLAIYRLARPQETAAEARALGLVLALNGSAAAPACANCSTPVDSSWLRCPGCATWLAAPCAQCGASSAVALEACPFCGSEAQRAAPHASPEPERRVSPEWKRAATSETPVAAIVAVRQPSRIVPSLRPASSGVSRESSS